MVYYLITFICSMWKTSLGLGSSFDALNSDVAEKYRLPIFGFCCYLDCPIVSSCNDLVEFGKSSLLLLRRLNG